MTSQNTFLLAADNSPALLPLLRSDESLASKQDAHGYSLMHAAASYGHLDLLRTLVNEFKVDVNIRDEDGETALFVVENVATARLLVQDLRAAVNIRNNDGQTAEEQIATEGDYPTVAAFLRENRLRSGPEANTPRTDQTHNQLDGDGIFADESPGPVPANMKVKVRTMEEVEGLAGQADVDPDFRKRIEELASRDDFGSAETQQDLRDLVHDAVKKADVPTADRDVRQRLR